MPVVVDLDLVMERQGIGVAESAERVGITPANIAVLKNGRARAVRFSTLDGLCQALDCQPGDILRWVSDANPEG
jgi:putative transcriptional regulator